MTWRDTQLRALERRRGLLAPLRRAIVLVLVPLLLSPLVSASYLAAAKRPAAYVFAPSSLKVRTVEQTLKQALPTLDVTVFGKYRDFERFVRDSPPAVAIASPVQLEALGLSPRLRGMRRGSDSVRYVLVTVGSAVDPTTMATGTVGALGILNLSAMKGWCGEVLGTEGQKVRTVTKYEDLLPLLLFGVAKGVLLPETESAALLGRSKLKLVVNRLDARVGLVSVAVLDRTAESAVLGALRGMDTGSLSVLGVDAWK